jgi:hypothetical protein
MSFPTENGGSLSIFAYLKETDSRMLRDEIEAENREGKAFHYSIKN